jgi:hypothetical protein
LHMGVPERELNPRSIRYLSSDFAASLTNC